jgi:ABC-type multidrug transport system fused ATPase/permease subunit
LQHVQTTHGHQRQPRRRRPLWRLWPEVKPNLLVVILAFAQAGLTALFGLLSPWLLGVVIDEVLRAERWQWLLPGAGALILLSVLQGLTRFGQRYTIEIVAQQVIFRLRSRLYAKLQSLSFRFFDQARTGELMTRVTADVETLRQALSFATINGLVSIGSLLGTIVAVFLLNWKLALVAMLFMPFLLHAVTGFSRRVRPAMHAVQEQNAKLSGLMQENIQGVRVVRAFGTEAREIAKFTPANQALRDRQVDSARLSAFWSNYMSFLATASGALVLSFGGWLVVRGDLSIGELVAFNAYLAGLMNPIRFLALFANVWSRALVGLERIFDLLDTEADVAEKPGARPLPRVQGEIRFENVSFGYDPHSPVLQEINLHIKPGERVAILGLTGSGKSSLLQLVPRFYDPTAGRVLIDGHDLRDVTLASLRGQIGVVMQETFLFSATLRENIAYGKPDATLAEVEAAARAAQIHDFIVSLPKGYDTVVGERGVGLSGGQKQRVAIARTLLLNSPIVLLDESTSAVDVATEQRIQAAMDRVMEQRTSLVIAQRISTVMRADRILVLEGGRIAEQGTHAELLQRGGLYRRIFDLQFGAAAQTAPAAQPAEHEGVAR